MRYEKRVVFPLVAMVVLIAIVFSFSMFSKDVAFSPTEEDVPPMQIEQNGQEILLGALGREESSQEEITEKLSYALSEHKDDYSQLVLRYHSNPSNFPEDSPVKPVELDMSNYNVQITHGEEIIDEEIKQIPTVFHLIDPRENLADAIPREIHVINENGYPVSVGAIFGSKVYDANGEIYAVITEPIEQQKHGVAGQDEHDGLESPITGNSITGFQVYSPPVPFNQVNRSFAVIVPYNNNYPLSSNTVNYLNARWANIRAYFQANSEGTATYTFTVYPINVPGYAPYQQDINLTSIVYAADPFINYSQYDMALIYAERPYFANCCSGYATMAFNNLNVVKYFNTNEPLLWAVPVMFFKTSTSAQYIEFLTEHEIGHDLPAFNPGIQPNYFGGYLPHAQGWGPCSANGQLLSCSQDEYGDLLDVMGHGRGLYSHHRAVHNLGFRNPSSVQSVSASGTYNLCSTNHPAPANCPQELLIQNPNGANLALEMIANPVGPQYSIYPSCGHIFDEIILRATDMEQGGGLGNIFYNSNFGGGDVIYPASYTTSNCLNPFAGPVGNSNLLDFTLHQGQSITTPVGTINFQSLATTATGKRANLSILYNAPCALVPLPPEVRVWDWNTGSYSLQPNLRAYAQNLWPISPNQSPIRLRIARAATCSAMLPENISIVLHVNVNGTYQSSLINITSFPPQPLVGGYGYLEANLPQSLIGVPAGTYPVSIGVIVIGSTFYTNLYGQLELVNYNPFEFYAIAPGACSDTDFVNYTSQNLGANFQSSAGGTFAPFPQLAGLPPILQFSDWCGNDGITANDLICGYHIPGIPLNLANHGAILKRDCRFEMNNPNAFCYNGVCY